MQAAISVDSPASNLKWAPETESDACARGVSDVLSRTRRRNASGKYPSRAIS